MAAFETVVARLSSDPGTWARVQSELESAKDPPGRFMELAREHGMSIDRTEIERAIANRTTELSDGELDSIAGGVGLRSDGSTDAAQAQAKVLLSQYAINGNSP